MLRFPKYLTFFFVIVEDDADVPPEALIPKYQLQELCSEAAKLKNLGAMESFPADRLVRLLNILEKNIRDGVRVCPLADPVSFVFIVPINSTLDGVPFTLFATCCRMRMKRRANSG